VDILPGERPVLLMSFVVTLGVGVLVAIAPVVQAARGSCDMRCNAAASREATRSGSWPTVLQAAMTAVSSLAPACSR
jgi:hypothetical protein